MAQRLFATLPPSLETALVDEFRDLQRNYREHRWRASELAGGRFCEVVYSILKGDVDGAYPAAPYKPSDFRGSCRQLENQPALGTGLRFLVLPLLTVLYEVRNNRGVGHVGGDVDSNAVDAFAVVAQSSWILAELVRNYNSVPLREAQKLVDRLAEYPSPLIFVEGGYRRVLKIGLSLRDELVLLVASTEARESSVDDLSSWTGQPNKTYIRKVLGQLDEARLLRFSRAEDLAQLLPTGQKIADELAMTHTLKT
ncbi:MAG: hypothetical protein HY834_10070 [Devosia nanyangense]|uniref:Uncharacterized protein n=1 Tax=Devosia nanyangense TaxID=1228055 RepID=A0A933NYB2_9HYPH|nr:hypothetical protein [Devosia nanyangense]